MGKTMGIVGPIVKSGAFLGPMVAGVLFSSVGYWRAWSVAIAMIALDLVLRLTMTERPKVVEGVATNDHVKLRCDGEGEIEEAPTANARDQDSCSNSATRSYTGSEQRK